MNAVETSAFTLRLGNALEVLRDLPSESVHCIVTSPPYFGLRNYAIKPSTWGDGWVGCLGNEPTLSMYIDHMVEIFREARRVLRHDGTLWLNLGDSYNNTRPGARDADLWPKQSRNDHTHDKTLVPEAKRKELLLVPARVAIALSQDGWYLRSDIIWNKPNAMPESVNDRPAKAHEYIFLFAKSESYFYDSVSIKEAATTAGKSRKTPDGWDTSKSAHGSFHPNGREKGKQNGVQGATKNKRSVWTVSTSPFKGAHFATFPLKLITPCILAGTSEKGVCQYCGAAWRRKKILVGNQITESMIAAGADRNGAYNGAATKNFAAAKAQNASDSKRRILESMSRVYEYEWIQGCDCFPSDPLKATVLDPFSGSGTTGVVALKNGRNYIGIELNLEYLEMSRERLKSV